MHQATSTRATRHPQGNQPLCLAPASPCQRTILLRKQQHTGQGCPPTSVTNTRVHHLGNLAPRCYACNPPRSCKALLLVASHKGTTISSAPDPGEKGLEPFQHWEQDKPFIKRYPFSRCTSSASKQCSVTHQEYTRLHSNHFTEEILSMRSKERLLHSGLAGSSPCAAATSSQGPSAAPRPSGRDTL